ncbi:hypothetical protein BGZ60DRAFT_418571 [Tricladium varicosporioides]|nr:hypothetical protein BGZ60DRAFT_418571 [Hymenoscyphus varicosporioides]
MIFCFIITQPGYVKSLGMSTCLELVRKTCRSLKKIKRRQNTGANMRYFISLILLWGFLLFLFSGTDIMPSGARLFVLVMYLKHKLIIMGWKFPRLWIIERFLRIR